MSWDGMIYSRQEIELGTSVDVEVAEDRSTGNNCGVGNKI